MDNKTSRKADEPSATRLSPLASKSQARGESIEELKDLERAHNRDRK